MRVRSNSTATVASDRRATSHTRFTDTRESGHTLAGESLFICDSNSAECTRRVRESFQFNCKFVLLSTDFFLIIKFAHFFKQIATKTVGVK